MVIQVNHPYGHLVIGQEQLFGIAIGIGIEYFATCAMGHEIDTIAR